MFTSYQPENIKELLELMPNEYIDNGAIEKKIRVFKDY